MKIKEKRRERRRHRRSASPVRYDLEENTPRGNRPAVGSPVDRRTLAITPDLWSSSPIHLQFHHLSVAHSRYVRYRIDCFGFFLFLFVSMENDEILEAFHEFFLLLFFRWNCWFIGFLGLKMWWNLKRDWRYCREWILW